MPVGRAQWHTGREVVPGYSGGPAGESHPTSDRRRHTGGWLPSTGQPDPWARRRSKERLRAWERVSGRGEGTGAGLPLQRPSAVGIRAPAPAPQRAAVPPAEGAGGLDPSPEPPARDMVELRGVEPLTS